MISQISGVLCCGSVCRDIVVRPVNHIRWGTSTWVDQIEESIGGHGANTSTALARMATPVRLLGLTGRDSAGDLLRSMLQDAGVDISAVGLSEASTTTSISLVQASGERAFLHQPGSSTEVTAEKLLPKLHSAGYSHFHLATFFAFPQLRFEAATVLAKARRLGLTTSLDPGWDARERWFTDLAPVLPHVDLLFLNEVEAQQLTGSVQPAEAVRFLREHGAHDVVVKLGAAGCTVFADEANTKREEVPGFQIVAVDATGAGDCFAGGFLAGLYRGLSYSASASLANAVGALCVSRLGATTGLLNYEETRKWMAAAPFRS